MVKWVHGRRMRRVLKLCRCPIIQRMHGVADAVGGVRQVGVPVVTGLHEAAVAAAEVEQRDAVAAQHGMVAVAA